MRISIHRTCVYIYDDEGELIGTVELTINNTTWAVLASEFDGTARVISEHNTRELALIQAGIYLADFQRDTASKVAPCRGHAAASDEEIDKIVSLGED